MILILEDNPDRTRAFRAAAGAIAPELPVRFWTSAPAMVRDLAGLLGGASLVSLDHDLVRHPGDAGADDLGTGYDVVKFLCTLAPCCPVIIHTSNAERGTWMEGELSRAGWEYHRVCPIGEDWIENLWAPLVARRLGRGK